MPERIVCQITNSPGERTQRGGGVSYSCPSLTDLIRARDIPFFIAIGILSLSSPRDNGAFVASDVTFVIRLRASLSL
jgi:hypothetical protein